MAIFHSYVKLRAGVMVYPERNELRLKEAHFTAQAQCFITLKHLWVPMFHVKFSEKSVGKVNPLRTSCMSAFSRFSFFLSYINPKGNPSRNIANCSMGPGDFITCINPKGNPNRNRVNCSMGWWDFITCIQLVYTLNETQREIWRIVPWGPGVL